MTDEDAQVAEEHGGRSFTVDLGDDGYRIRLVTSDPRRTTASTTSVANPMLWFIQHYLWDLSNAPDIRQEEVEAYEDGYCTVNEDLARAVLDELEGEEEAVVMLHDYHLYLAPKFIRQERPDLFLHHFVHIPWTQPDAWRVLPADMREDIYEGILSNDIIAFHTRSYRRNFLLCCRELFDLEVDEEAGIVKFDGRDVWVRSYPLPISAETFQRTAQRPAVHEYEREILRRRREHLILRVDRADLSKNVLRGFTAFDLFLEQQPRPSGAGHVRRAPGPSRQDVPRTPRPRAGRGAVARGTTATRATDSIPSRASAAGDLEEAIAAYEHFDLLMVDACSTASTWSRRRARWSTAQRVSL